MDAEQRARTTIATARERAPKGVAVRVKGRASPRALGVLISMKLHAVFKRAG